MATFLSWALLMAAFVPVAFSLGLQLGGGIDLGGGLGLDLPSLNVGLSVDHLIDVQTASELLAASYDPQEVIHDCEIPHHRSRNTYHARTVLRDGGTWYRFKNSTNIYVPIFIDPAFNKSEVEKIYAGMLDIQNGTCVRLRIYKNETFLINRGADYVYIKRGGVNDGCRSDSVGRAHVGRQTVYLEAQALNCSHCRHCITPGTVAHEILHAIGFNHEHNSPGRDRYVSIQWSNIESGTESQFEELCAEKYWGYGAPYDYDSIMHYEKDAFSINGQDTIITLNGAAIGQVKGLSQWDRYKINRMHDCPVHFCI